MNGDAYIGQALREHGVSHVFLVPAILRRSLVVMEQLGICRVTAHTEQAAAYMADGFARVAGRPTVVMAQSVGAANLAAGLQDAYLGHSPVIALTGRKPPMFQYRNAYQEIDHVRMFDAVTKYNVCVDEAAQLPFILPQLFREAVCGTPAPVHADVLGLSGEMIEQQQVDDPVFKQWQTASVPAHRIAADETCVQKAVRRLESAKRPIIVAGGGAIVSGAHAEVLTLAQRLDVPVATSSDAKGIIPEDHPLSVGVVGSYSQQCANRSVSEADLVLFIGSATGDQVTLDWTIPAVGTPVIQIDINPLELGRNYPNALGLLGDARTVMRQMLAHMHLNQQRRAWVETVGRYVRQWRQLTEQTRRSDAEPIRPERLCEEVSRNLPEDAILFSDTGYSCVWAGTMIRITRPTQRFVRAAGSLGWAFPASLGGKFAAPDRPVFCFCGDGAFLYHVSELETARRWGINSVTIVNNNSYFGQSIPGMLKAYDSTFGNAHQIVQFEKLDFARIAENFGCIGIRVEKPSEIAQAMRVARRAERPVVIDVATNHECHPLDLWRPSASAGEEQNTPDDPRAVDAAVTPKPVG